MNGIVVADDGSEMAAEVWEFLVDGRDVRAGLVEGWRKRKNEKKSGKREIIEEYLLFVCVLSLLATEKLRGKFCELRSAPNGRKDRLK
jgi:hypothetical protein